MDISVFSAQNILRTYNHLLNSKLSREKQAGPKGSESHREPSSHFDRVTISEDARRILEELNVSAKEADGTNVQESGSEEESI